MKLSYYFKAVVCSLMTFKIIGSQLLSVSLSPSIITTKESFTVSVNNKGNKFTKYKYSFGSWQMQTTRNVIDYRYFTSGVYTLKVAAILNGSWTPWTKKIIKVFDHDTVARSKCWINILPLVQSSTEATLVGENVTLAVNITLKDCYGVCELFFNSTSNRIALANSFISYGQNENHMVAFNSAYCGESQVHFQIATLTKVITKVVNLASLWKPEKCQPTASPNTTLISSASRSGYNSTKLLTQQIAVLPTTPTPVAVYGTLNVVVAVFFTLFLGFYLTVIFLSYLENKKFLRSVINLTDLNDEVMYEVQFHVGSAFSSVQSSSCEIHFTIYGTNNVIGPVTLPVSPFEQDGVASFLISTMKTLGDIGTICVFCKDMNLRSDWYLRKVEIFSHSQKPSGSHWSDDDEIKSIAEFECHTWFQPALKTDSVAQVFHSNIVGNETSLPLYYLRRCNQLFSQKHILTSWRCSFGITNFSKTQRLSFLYTLWLVIICMSSFYIGESGLSEVSQTKHEYRIGILRLDEPALYFAFTRGISAYVIGIVMCFVVRLLLGQDDESLKPDHVDSRGRRVYDMGGGKVRTTETNGRYKESESYIDDQMDVYIEGVTFSDDQRRISVDTQLYLEDNKTNTVDQKIPPNGHHLENGLENGSLEVNCVVLQLGGSEKIEHAEEKRQSNGISDRHYEPERTEDKEIKSRAPQEPSEESLQDEMPSVEETDGAEVANDFVEVQFFNRETLPTVKEDQWRQLILRFSARLFWIAFTILLLFCLFYSLVISTEWSRDVAYHWLSYHLLAFVFSCWFIDTVRVVLYILTITLRERRYMHSKMKRMSFEDFETLLLASKRAVKDKEDFCRAEYPEDKMKFAQDYQRLQGKFRDLFVLAIFVASLLTLTAWTVDKRSYMINKTLTRDLLNINDLYLMQKDRKANPFGKFWSWFEKTLFPIIDPTKRDVSLQGFYLLEKWLFLSQRRVVTDKCDIAKEVEGIVGDCSLELDDATENFATYLPGWKTLPPGYVYDPFLYEWEYKRDTKYSSNTSQQSYPVEGYIARFDIKSANATINELKTFNWIDRYSRQLSLECFLFDASMNLMSQIAIKLEFQTSGYIDIQTRFHSFSILSESSPKFEWLQVVESISFTLTMYFAFDILKRKQRTSASWMSLWLIIQTILTILSFVTLSLYFYKNYNIYLLALDSVSSYKKSEIYRTVISLQRTLEYILAMLNIFALVFLTKPLFTLGLFDDMYIAVSRTMRDMKGIAMETVVLLIGLGCWANLAFAGAISSFSSLRTTFPTLMDMLVRPDNAELYNIRFFGPFFLLTYFLVMVLIVTNIFISSVEQSYSGAREVIDQIRRETVFKLLFKKFKKKRLEEHSYLSFQSRTARKQKDGNLLAQNAEESSDKASGITTNEGMGDTIDSQDQAPENDSLILSLEHSIEKLQAFVDNKVLFEHMEDKVLISAMTEKWNKVVLKRPPLSIIPLYKPMIRK